MLPRVNRLTAGDDFRRAIRTGRRSGSATVVVHACLGPDPAAGPGASADDLPGGVRVTGTAPGRVGFVVSKAVGSAVTRNRVKRRLRHLCRARLAALPAASLVVVRALPEAATASSAQLEADLERCLRRAGWAG